MSVAILPSMTISAVAGTSRSTVRHLISGIASPARPPARRYSSKAYGSLAGAAEAIAGITPVAVAASGGIPFAWHFFQCMALGWPRNSPPGRFGALGWLG